MNVTKKDKKKRKDSYSVSYTVESFGEKLIELRNERNITQTESAELIGITRNTLSMYERCERCPNIDIAVNVANVYNVSLDYLFGTGYKNPKKNQYSMYDMGFSEEALDFLCSEENIYYVNAILSDPRIQKISDILYGSSYKPLINSYETNYISRLVSDLLYCILVDVTKGVYQLRPMSNDDTDELFNTVNDCIKQLENEEHLLRTDYDKYLDCCDTVQTELERIKTLLENYPSSDYHQAFEDGFSAAVKKFVSGEFKIASPLDESELQLEEKLKKYINKIPFKKSLSMSASELFEEARKLMEEDKA